MSSCLLSVLSILFVVVVNAYHQTTKISLKSKLLYPSTQLCAISKEEKEEQFRIQQEMLNRRKNKDQMKTYFEKVEDTRKQTATEVAKTTVWQKSRKDDVLEEWKDARAKGLIKPLGYEAEPDRKTSLFGNIIIPGNPIGMPKMDQGERFDLRLPYAERGYEDPDADVMGKMWSGITNLFGGSGNKKKTTEGDDNKNNNKDPKAPYNTNNKKK